MQRYNVRRRGRARGGAQGARALGHARMWAQVRTRTGAYERRPHGFAQASRSSSGRALATSVEAPMGATDAKLSRRRIIVVPVLIIVVGMKAKSARAVNHSNSDIY